MSQMVTYMMVGGIVLLVLIGIGLNINKILGEQEQRGIKELSSVFQLGRLSLTFESKPKILMHCFFDDKGCTGRSQSQCTGACAWRNNACEPAATTATYLFSPNNLKMSYRGEIEKLPIISVAEFSSDPPTRRLVFGKDALYNSIKVVTYPDEPTLQFYYKVEDLPKPTKIEKFVHLSFWHESDCVKNYMNRCTGRNDQASCAAPKDDKGEQVCSWNAQSSKCSDNEDKFSFGGLSDRCKEDYLAAVGVEMWINEDSTCYRALCPNFDTEQACAQTGAGKCYWCASGAPAVSCRTGLGSNCFPCPSSTNCGDFSTREQCTQCAPATTRCAWVDDECRYKDGDKGRLLHIKIDPDDNPTEVFEFHLSDTPRHRGSYDIFFSTEHCNVYAENEESTTIFGSSSVTSHWQIRSGGIITKDSRIYTHRIQDNDCESTTIDMIPRIYQTSYSGQPNTASPCPVNERYVGGAPYTTTPNNNQPCTDTACQLLEKGADNKFYWKPKSELLCVNGLWEACTDARSGNIIGFDAGTFRCSNGRWLPEGTSTPNTCPDSTAYGRCSSTKPKYCDNSGSLQENYCYGPDRIAGNADDCGCSTGTCQSDGRCVATFTVSGTVSDTTGNKIQDTEMAAYNLDFSARNRTNERGNYEMSVRNGVYNIFAYKPGFEPNLITNSIVDRNMALNFVLEPKTDSYKLRILFVPLGQWQSQSAFEDEARAQLNAFLANVPLNSCRNKVNTDFVSVQTGDCRNWNDCSIERMVDCIPEPYKSRYNSFFYDVVAGVTKASPCSPVVGRSTGFRSLWFTSDISAEPDDAFTLAHEIGHIFGLKEQYCSRVAGSANPGCNDGGTRCTAGSTTINPLSKALGCNPVGHSTTACGETQPDTSCCETANLGECERNALCCEGNINPLGGRSIMSYAGAAGPSSYDANEQAYLGNQYALTC
ncbi:MAG: hypothetical protein HYY37_02380 [Candidatus Aenigmarchaeota archaeon]|nr:hypothetical protein [Candidatus Aenigmarchaeota archaeon]